MVPWSTCAPARTVATEKTQSAINSQRTMDQRDLGCAASKCCSMIFPLIFSRLRPGCAVASSVTVRWSYAYLGKDPDCLQWGPWTTVDRQAPQRDRECHSA